jgi:hypothetical protein
MTIFLNLTNRVLRRLNEVELTQSDFESARGIQAAAKDAINSAIFDFNAQQYEWPFNAAEESTQVVIGQTEYSYPTRAKTMEWNSFQIVGDGTFSADSCSLKYIDRDVWYQNYRDRDDDAATVGVGKPEFVFPSHGLGFGISPAPDKTYRLQFRYFLHPQELVVYNDTPTGALVYPDVLTPIFVEGALYHIYMFKDNPESAQLALRNFEQSVADMKSQYINTYSEIRDTRVNFGGGNSSTSFRSVSGY